MEYLHTMVRVSGLNASLDFYCTQLGLGEPEAYDGGRNFGHLAFRVDDIYELCQRLSDAGGTINRPPRDGHVAFVRSPNGISVELHQKGPALPLAEPWASMPNARDW